MATQVSAQSFQSYCLRALAVSQLNGWSHGEVESYRQGRLEFFLRKGRYGVNCVAMPDGTIWAEILTKSNRDNTYNPPRSSSSQFDGKLIDCLREADRRIAYWAKVDKGIA
jgi:hypothetical protein